MDESNANEAWSLQPSYTESNIRVLEGWEAIRKRPAMYLGSTDGRGLRGMLELLIEFAIKPIAGGSISVTLHRNGAATVKDDGQGFPIKDPSSPHSIEKAMAGFHRNSRTRSLDLAIVTALSSSVEVEMIRGGFRWRQSFARGEATSPLERLGPTREIGSAFTFRPDPEIFDAASFDDDPIANRLEELAALNPEIRFDFLDERTGRAETWECRDGLVSLVRKLNLGHKPLHEPISFKGRCGKTEVSFAFQYNEGVGTQLLVFADHHRLDMGLETTGRNRSDLRFHARSFHVVGFLKALRAALEPSRNPAICNARRSEAVRNDGLLEGMTAVVTIRLEDPLFWGCLRSQLVNPEAEPIAFSVAFLRLFAYFEEHPGVARRIREKISIPD